MEATQDRAAHHVGLTTLRAFAIAALPICGREASDPISVAERAYDIAEAMAGVEAERLKER
jgi:hypothetical protein